MKDTNRQNIINTINSFVEKNENYFHDSLEKIPIGSPLRIQTSKYNNPFYISIGQSVENIIESIKELQKKLNLKKEDLYLIISPNMLKDDSVSNKIIEFINALEDAYTVVFEGNYLNDNLDKTNSNVFYTYKGTNVDLNTIYEHVINDNLFCAPNESLSVLIPNIYEDEPYKLECLINYMKTKFPKTEIKFGIHVLDKNNLLLLKDIMSIIKDETLFVYLNDDLFSQEEKNANSARSILRNKNELDLLIQSENEKENIKFNYLNFTYNSLKEIIDLEKNLDVLYSRIPSKAKDIDKITFITLFMLNYFDTKNDHKVRTMFEFFKDRVGVCRDYADFSNKILNDINVSSRVITGFYVKDDFDVDGHRFNVVNIEGIEYFLDITWLAEDLKYKAVFNIEDSPNFLESNFNFYPSHKNYLRKDDTVCEQYDREEIRKSIKRVKSWKNNYYISINGIKDLLRKSTENELEFSQDILDSLPRKGGR